MKFPLITCAVRQLTLSTIRSAALVSQWIVPMLRARAMNTAKAPALVVVHAPAITNPNLERNKKTEHVFGLFVCINLFICRIEEKDPRLRGMCSYLPRK